MIPFAGSSYDSVVTIDIKENSELLYTDIVTAGRVGMGEQFAFRHYHSRVCVRIDGLPVWIDNCLLEPGFMDMQNMVLFDHYTHMGTLYYYHGWANAEDSGPDHDISAARQTEEEVPVLLGRTDIDEKILQMNGRTYDNMLIGASSQGHPGECALECSRIPHRILRSCLDRL